MSHTPGPWFLIENVFGQYLIADADGYGIINGCCEGGLAAYPTLHEDPDLRLAIAAPDLLEVAEAWVAEHEAHCSNPEFCCANNPIFIKARAAIAKARGEA